MSVLKGGELFPERRNLAIPAGKSWEELATLLGVWGTLTAEGIVYHVMYCSIPLAAGRRALSVVNYCNNCHFSVISVSVHCSNEQVSTVPLSKAYFWLRSFSNSLKSLF
jgi:hypothetical protein